MGASTDLFDPLLQNCAIAAFQLKQETKELLYHRDRIQDKLLIAQEENWGLLASFSDQTVILIPKLCELSHVLVPHTIRVPGTFWHSGVGKERKQAEQGRDHIEWVPHDAYRLVNCELCSFDLAVRKVRLRYPDRIVTEHSFTQEARVLQRQTLTDLPVRTCVDTCYLLDYLAAE